MKEMSVLGQNLNPTLPSFIGNDYFIRGKNYVHVHNTDLHEIWLVSKPMVVPRAYRKKAP